MKMNKKGFTLIEMLVVIAIIAILVAIIIPTVSNATTKAREAADVANVRSYIAQLQIQQLNGESVTFTKPTALNYPDKCTATTTSGVITVVYDSETLNDGNFTGDDSKYTWDVGELLTDTTT